MQRDEMLCKSYLDGYHKLINRKGGRRRTRLEESVNLASDGVNVNVEVAGSRGETGDGLDIGSKCVPNNVSKMDRNVIEKKTYK